jgi:hypothetical protein
MKALPLVIVTLIAGGCSSDAGTGALIGAGIGAGAGALISPTAGGVLIGAGVGAATGAAIGAALDASDREKVQERSPQTIKKIDRGEQLSTTDIEKMSQAGISDDKIISTIQSTGSVFHLSASDVQKLEDAGVSKRVIDYMLRTAYE